MKTFSIDLPTKAFETFRDEFFIGAWRAGGGLHVEFDTEVDSTKHSWLAGANWFLLGSRSPFNGTALVHPTTTGGLAFRGYQVDVPTHSWSGTKRIDDACADGMGNRPNGVFAFARVTDDALQLQSDAFGMSPFYYRRVDDVVLFATKPRFLVLPGDQPDYFAWASRIVFGTPLGDHSPFDGVRRVPAGATTTISAVGERIDRWYDYAAMPEGTEPIDEQAVAAVEEALHRSIDRCLQLQTSGVILPLTSGYDSRRLLAVLLDRKADFRAVTVRVAQRNHYLDARFAAEMASDLGFAHAVADMPLGDSYTKLARSRRMLTDAASSEHAWAVVLRDLLPDQTALVFDGIAGDVWGETGFEKMFHYQGSEAAVLEDLAQCLFSDIIRGLLRGRAWPNYDVLYDEVRRWLRTFPAHQRSDLAWLMSRTRRDIALCFQSMMPPGHVIACPYLDLDYVEVVQRYSPQDKLKTSLQDLTLKRHHPRLYAYPGSRRFPSDVTARDDDYLLEEIELMATLCELRRTIDTKTLSNVLSLRHRLRLALSPYSQHLSQRSSWWVQPLGDLLVNHVQSHPVWRRKS